MQNIEAKMGLNYGAKFLPQALKENHVHANPRRLADALAEPTAVHNEYSFYRNPAGFENRQRTSTTPAAANNFPFFLRHLSTDFSLSITEIDNHGRRSRYPADAQVHPQPSACPETDGRVRLSFSCFYRFFGVLSIWVVIGMTCGYFVRCFFSMEMPSNLQEGGEGREILYHRGMDDQEGKIHQTNNPL